MGKNNTKSKGHCSKYVELKRRKKNHTQNLILIFFCIIFPIRTMSRYDCKQVLFHIFFFLTFIQLHYSINIAAKLLYLFFFFTFYYKICTCVVQKNHAVHFNENFYTSYKFYIKKKKREEKKM